MFAGQAFPVDPLRGFSVAQTRRPAPSLRTLRKMSAPCLPTSGKANSCKKLRTFLASREIMLFVFSPCTSPSRSGGLPPQREKNVQHKRGGSDTSSVEKSHNRLSSAAKAEAMATTEDATKAIAEEPMPVEEPVDTSEAGENLSRGSISIENVVGPHHLKRRVSFPSLFAELRQPRAESVVT